MAYSQQDYEKAGQWIAENLSDPQAIANQIQSMGLSQEDILKAVQTQNAGFTMGDVTNWFADQNVNPWATQTTTPTTVTPAAYDPYSVYGVDQTRQFEEQGLDPFDQTAVEQYLTGYTPPVSASEQDITNLYQQYFGRAPDPEGLAFWVTAGQNGYTPEMIAAEFEKSPEYQMLQSSADDGTTTTTADTGKYSAQDYTRAGQWIAENLNNPQAVAAQIQNLGLTPEDVLRAVQTQNAGFTMGDVTGWLSSQGVDPWATTGSTDVNQSLVDAGLTDTTGVTDTSGVTAGTTEQPDVDKLKNQLLTQWTQINPEYLSGTLSKSGLTIDQLAAKFAQQAADAGITDLSQLTLGSTTEQVLGVEGEGATPTYDVTRNYLTAGDKKIGYVGEGQGQQYLDDPDAVNRAMYSYAFGDPTSAGRLFGTAEGTGWTAGEVVQGPDGKLYILPSWGSSSDAADILKAVQMGLMFVPGAGQAIGTALGAGTGVAANMLGNAVLGGTLSELAGGDFLKGAVTSGLTSGLTSGVSDMFGSTLKDIGSSVASATGSQVVGDAVTNALQRGLASGTTALLTGNSALDAAVNSALQGFVSSSVTGLTGEVLADVPAPIRDAATSAAVAAAQGGDSEAITQAALKSLVQSTINQLKTDEKTAKLVEDAYADKSRGQDVLGNQGAYDYTPAEVKAVEDSLSTDVLNQLVYDGSDYQDFDDAIANARAEGFTQVRDANGKVYNLTPSAATSDTVDDAMRRDVAEQLIYDGTDYADFDDAVANAKAEGYTQVRGPDGKVYNIGTAAPTSADVLAVAKDFSGYNSFGSAYSAARELLGPNSTFTYNGKEYSTAAKEERPDLTGKTEEWITPAPVTGADSVAQVKTYLGGLLNNPDFNPADLKAGEMSAFVDAYANATPAQRQAMLQGTDRATFTVIDNLLKKEAGALATQPVPAGTPDLKAPPATFEDAANYVGSVIGGVTFKGAGELIKLAGVAGDWMGADPDNVVYNFGKAVETFGQNLTPLSIQDQQKNIVAAVSAATGDTPFEAGLNKLGAAVASSIQNPLGLADWIGSELIQEIVPLTAAVKVGKAVTAASKLAFGEKIASTFGLGSAIATDATLNAGESATASYDEVYRTLRKAGVSEEEAASAASKAAITAGAATLFTSAIGDSKIVGSLLDVAKGAAIKSVAREAPSEYVEGFLQSVGDQYFTSGQVSLDKAMTGGTIEALVGAGTSGTIGAGIDATNIANQPSSDLDIKPIIPSVGGGDTGGDGGGGGDIDNDGNDDGDGTGGGGDIGSKPDDSGDIFEDKSGAEVAPDNIQQPPEDIIQKLEDSGLQLVDNAEQLVADYNNAALSGDVSASGLTADTVIATDADGNTITAGDLGLVPTVTADTTAVSKEGATSVATQTNTDPNTGVKTQTQTNPATNVTTTVATDPNTNTQTKTVTDVNNNTQTQTQVNQDTNVQTQTKTDGKTNTQTAVVSDPNTNTQTQTKVDSNTGVESTTTINNNTNTQTTVVTDPNTKTQTQTTIDNNTGVTTSITVDNNTNVTTTVTTDPNTNTTTETTTNTNTNTETTVTTNTDTGIKITTETDLVTGETVVTDVDVVEPVEVVTPEVVTQPEVQPPPKPPAKPKTPTKPSAPVMFAPQAQQMAPMAAPALANVFYAGTLTPGERQAAASVTDFQAQQAKLAKALGSKFVADDEESDENDEKAQQSEQLRQILAAIDGQEDFADVDELMQYVMRG